MNRWEATLVKCCKRSNVSVKGTYGKDSENGLPRASFLCPSALGFTRHGNILRPSRGVAS